MAHSSYTKSQSIILFAGDRISRQSIGDLLCSRCRSHSQWTATSKTSCSAWDRPDEFLFLDGSRSRTKGCPCGHAPKGKASAAGRFDCRRCSAHAGGGFGIACPVSSPVLNLLSRQLRDRAAPHTKRRKPRHAGDLSLLPYFRSARAINDLARATVASGLA